MLSKKLWLVIIILILLGGFILKKEALKPKQPVPATPANSQSQNEGPRLISTKPDPLENAVIPASGQIEITFNKPLQNIGEFKSRIEPKIDYKVQLSDDRKTAKVVWAKPLDLGTTYTFFIEPDTKFDGVGNWGQEKIFHFQTIKYTGV